MRTATTTIGRFALALLCVLCLRPAARAQEGTRHPPAGGNAGAQGLEVKAPQPIMINPDTASGDAYLLLTNKTTSPVKVLLSAGPLTNTATGQEVKATITIGEATGGAASVVYTGTVRAGEPLALRVEVAGLNEAGEVVAELMSHGTPLGAQLRALNYHFPFSVKLAPESESLRLAPGVPTPLVIVNDDNVPYTIKWRLLVSGKPLSTSDKDKTYFEDKLSPGGATPLLFEPPQTLFSDVSGWLSSLFREDIRDAVLELRPKLRQGLDSSYLPVRTMPVKVRLGYWAPFSQQLAGTAVVFLVLLAGGITSLLLSYFLPNLLRRRDIKDRLQALDASAGSISDRIDSSLRVLMRVERRRLKELLKAAPITSPDMNRIFTHSEQGISLLESRVNLMEDIDTVYDRLTAAQALCPPPSLKDRVEQHLWKAAAMLREPNLQDADFQVARTLIDEARVGTERLSLGDEEFKKDLSQRSADLSADIYPAGQVSLTGKLADLHDKLPGPFEMLKRYSGADIPPHMLSSVDVNLSALSVLRDYAQIHEGTRVPVVREKLDSQEPELLRLLSLQSWSSLRNSRLLLRQMKEGIYAADVLEAMRAGEVYMEVMPQMLRPFEPARFGVRFQHPEIDGSAARELFQCEWVFDGTYEERGWDITHYFAVGEKHRARAWFIAPDGQVVTADGSAEKVTVEKVLMVPADKSSGKWDRLMAEWVRLMIALFIALLGLIMGAQDQLAKMDFVPGMIAVFLLGFSADAIKNLLTQRTQPSA